MPLRADVVPVLVAPENRQRFLPPAAAYSAPANRCWPLRCTTRASAPAGVRSHPDKSRSNAAPAPPRAPKAATVLVAPAAWHGWYPPTAPADTHPCWRSAHKRYAATHSLPPSYRSGSHHGTAYRPVPRPAPPANVHDDLRRLEPCHSLSHKDG